MEMNRPLVKSSTFSNLNEFASRRSQQHQGNSVFSGFNFPTKRFHLAIKITSCSIVLLSPTMSKSLAAALPLLLLILAAMDVEASVSQSRVTLSSHLKVQRSKIGRSPFVVVRGGATVTEEEDEIDLDEEDGDEEEDEEEEEEDEELDPVMVKAAIKSSYKSKQKKTAAVKAKVSEKLASQAATKTAPIKKKKSGSLWGKVPYIIRVCLNPFTVIAMTRAYFVSLFNLNYLQEVRFTSTYSSPLCLV